MSFTSATSACIDDSKHKATINTMLAMKPSNRALVAVSEGVQLQAVTDSSLINLTEGHQMKLLNNKDWSGEVVGKYPEYVSNYHTGFVHIGSLPHCKDGSKGAVVYSSINNPSGSGANCAWLMAWHVPIGRNNCKVYVECGPEDNYKPGVINWDTIQLNLDNSSYKSSSLDPDLGAVAFAQIELIDSIGRLASSFQVSL